uniref:Uncharacterized protein n=1 Tax=Falco tinnunculus TaxID=100819 RepID=A0A8C4TSE2_FALTI
MVGRRLRKSSKKARWMAGAGGLNPVVGKASQDEVSHIIGIQGVNHTIHHRQKDFVIKSLPMFTCGSWGEIVAEQPHMPAGCHYCGYVEGIPDSVVTLTTAAGWKLKLQEAAVPGMVMYKIITWTLVHVTRVLGYVLGMEHDDRCCSCGNTSKCITSAHSAVNYRFSNCSKKHYSDFLASGQGFCLNNVPELVTTFALQHCGNGVLEVRERCNCGSETQCKLDWCFLTGCCKSCQLLPKGEVCRESAGLCHLPEYCNGTSEHCPAEVAKQDGTVCTEAGCCYSGKCQSCTLQRMSIFGKEAKPAPLPCFQEVNVEGDRFGRCWGDGADVNFQKCKLENVVCGRVQCTNVRRLPQLEDHTTIVQTLVGDTWWWGTEYHLGAGVLAAGVIKDGMQCAEKMICINRMCVPEEKYLTSRCSAKIMCRGKGVCNAEGNCC